MRHPRLERRGLLGLLPPLLLERLRRRARRSRPRRSARGLGPPRFAGTLTSKPHEVPAALAAGAFARLDSANQTAGIGG